MFHSGSSRNGLQDSYNTFNENPRSSRQTIVNSSPFMHFPTSFLDEDDEMLVVRWLSQNEQQQEVLMGTSSLAETEGSFVAAKEGSTSAKKDECKSNINAEAYGQQRVPKEINKNKSNKSTKQSAPRKRSGKKDRHSKIYTAQGPRDRRMRLSLQIARKFFDLQDMLGFDKASKTIDWLLTRSKSAIKELTKNVQQENPRRSNGAKSMSSTSENEVVSGIKKCDTALNTDQGLIVGVGESSSPVAKPKEKRGRIKTRKAASSPITKESRDKARARARERTREKMKSKGTQEESKKSSGPNPNNSLKKNLDGNMDSTDQEMNSAMTSLVNEKESNNIQLAVAEADPWMDSLSMTENFLGFTGAISTFPSSSEASTYPSFPVLSGTNFKDTLPGFPGNLEILKARTLNNYHVQIPCVQGHNTLAEGHIPRTIFRSTSNAEDRNPNLFCQEHNGSSVFMNAPDVYLQTLLHKDQFFCNPTSTSRNDSLV